MIGRVQLVPDPSQARSPLRSQTDSDAAKTETVSSVRVNVSAKIGTGPFFIFVHRTSCFDEGSELSSTARLALLISRPLDLRQFCILPHSSR